MIRKSTILAILSLCCQAVSLAQSANFTAATTSGCSPLIVNFVDQSAGGPTTWFWDFGNGATSTLQNPSTTYFNPGSYTVKLTVTNPNGSNTITRTNYITIWGKPSVNFTVNDSISCYPHHAQFTDMSGEANGTSNSTWLWDFGDGNQGSTPNPVHTYTSSGNYTVTLKLTNNKGCYSVLTKSQYIHIAGGVQANFTNSQVNVCNPPFSVNFNNTSTGPDTLSYFWDFGDGSTSTDPSPGHQYNAPGNYTVYLATSSSGGCSDTLRKINLFQIQDIHSSFSAPDSICINAPVNFQNTSTPTPVSSIWHFGDGSTSSAQNPVRSYSQVYTYDVTLYNTYSYCTDSFTKSIKILPRPSAGFSGSPLFKCEPDLQVNFQDQSANAISWLWDFGDGQTSAQQNPSHTYTSYGVFDVKLIVTNSSGCTDTLVRPGYVNIKRPVIQLLPVPVRGCIPYTLNPVANITALDNVTSYLWDFGDGTQSTAANPSHVYSVQGTYTLSLTITTSTGCTETVSMANAVKVGRRPVVDFSAQPPTVCAFQMVLFTDLTNESDEWLWQFGDGGSADAHNPIHQYADTGLFTVTLYATNNGCRDSLTKTDYIRVKPPIARFYYITNCQNRKQFQFRDTSIGATSWFWDFGDGTNSSQQYPEHIFPNYGTYTVTLTVQNDTCTHTKTQVIKVVNPDPDFTTSPTTLCKTAAFHFTILGPTGNIVNYDWNFGNGNTVSTATPVVGMTYYTSGTYTVNLVTTDIYGCRDTMQKVNYIRVNGPTASFTGVNTRGCKGLTATFNDLSLPDNASNITNWQFDYGDGNIQSYNAPPFQHTYADSGIFSVKLIITDNNGCKDSVRIPNLVITTKPKAYFITSDTLSCPLSPVNFINNSTGVNYTSAWSFGDGGTSNVRNATHGYANTGLYPVKLVITDQYGCRDSITRPDYISINRPVASFTVNDSISSCTPFEVQFTNTSQYFWNTRWDLGGGNSTLNNPTMFYNTPGVYPIMLIVASPGWCSDTAYGTIRVYDTVGSRINYLPLNGCKPLNVDVNAFSPGPMTYTWDFGDGVLIQGSDTSISHIYNFFGNFIPKAIMTDPAGCIIAVTGLDTIRIKGATAKFGLDKTLFCDSGLVAFTDSTTYNDTLSSYNWDFGDGNISHLQEPVHYYSAPGIYSITLNVQTENSCVDTFRLNNVIKVVESPLITVGGDSVICVNEFMQHLGVFERTDTSVVQWTWAFPNGKNATVQNPVLQQYGTAGDFVVRAIARNSSGCADTATKNIHINALPTVSMPSTITMQAGFPVNIPASYSSGTNSWNWVPDNTLDCSNCPAPTASPKFNTLYTVYFVDSNGCKNAGQVQVIVICKNANVFVPNTFSPNADGANDVFYVRGRGLDRVKSIRVFNRWGEVVFEQTNFPVNNPAYGWDGKYKGNKPVPDVYVYQVEVFCENSQIIRFEGNVALIQ